MRAARGKAGIEFPVNSRQMTASFSSFSADLPQSFSSNLRSPVDET